MRSCPKMVVTQAFTTITQSDIGNYANTWQWSAAASDVTVDQSGLDNRVSSRQIGQRQTAELTQSGFEGDASNKQYGEDNAVTVTQSGDFNESDILQDSGSVS